MGARCAKGSKTNDIAGDFEPPPPPCSLSGHLPRRREVRRGRRPQPMAIKRGVDKAVEAVSKELGNIAKPTRDQKEIAQVGTISANLTPPSATSSPKRWPQGR